jgi:hypothetical protein
MLGFAGWYDNQPYRDILFYVPMQHLFFIGPTLIFLALSQKQETVYKSMHGKYQQQGTIKAKFKTHRAIK